MKESSNRKRTMISLGLLFFLCLTITPAYGTVQTPPPPEGGTLIWGPITLLREREKPKTEHLSIPISDPDGVFLLRLTNGTDGGRNRVSSALVMLNGQEIFRPSQLNQQVGGVTRQVKLLSGENLLDVTLRSAPGAFITLELFRLDRNACPVVDLHTFIRSTGKPIFETQTFELPPQFSSPFIFYLNNGNPDGSDRADSAIVNLNGSLVFGPNNFNEQVASLTQTVSLQPTNALAVQLRGSPGDRISVWITGYDNMPPHVTLTSPSNGATFTASPISVTGTVDDSSANVTVNGIPVPVGSDGSFTLDGIVLQEGENTIEVVATDECGNQGKDQIAVYLRTAPPGPQLVLCAVRIVPTIATTQEGEDCRQEAYAQDFGSIVGYMDETVVSVTLNNILLPDGVEINDQEPIIWAMREGTFFSADIRMPEVDGVHAFTAVATDGNGLTTQVTVTFIRDTVAPILTITSPQDGLVTSNPDITITGTIDDPLAVIISEYDGAEVPVTDGAFSTQVTLWEEGENYVLFSAYDPAFNFSTGVLRVTLDTHPPQINVTSPAEGAAVNTTTLSVTGTIIDPNKDTVTVAVNNGPPVPLSLTGANFSGAVAVVPGQNTLTFTATDKAGNTGQLTRSLLVDLNPPAVAISAPQPEAAISGVVTVMAEASDALSGIAGVGLYLDNQLRATLNQPPFNFTLDTRTFVSGLHTLTVKASDGAGNQAEASVNVTIDNTGPVMAFTSPVAGAAVSGSITVSIQATDTASGMASLSLYIDSQDQATLNQAPFNFPLNTLLFASGTHTIIARGTDRAGNQAETSIPVVFDHIPPSVSITSPAPGQTVSGSITVLVEAGDSGSGLTGVALLVDNQPQSTLNQPPFSFVVDTSGLSPGAHTLTAKAIDSVGNQAETSITIAVAEPMSIAITSPVSGSTINRSTVIVQGRIYNQTGEVGVVVNGILAEVEGADFAAIVPLQIGQNTTTATATTPDGLQGQTSIIITTETQQEVMRLTVTPASGILDQTGILNVTFEAEAFLINPILGYSWDFNGDGIAETTSAEPTATAQYQYPGIYFPRVTVTDNQGNAFTETTLVHVFSRGEMDALLRGKWEGLKTKLLNQDIPAALDYFIDSSKEVYQQAFNVIIDELPQITSDMQDIEIIFIFNNVAKYRINRIHNIDGILQTITYYIYFVKDLDGIWRIDKF